MMTGFPADVAIEHRTPVDMIEPQLDVRNASLRYIRVLDAFASRIGDALIQGDIKAARTAFWGGAYALGLQCCDNVSMTRCASFVGVTRATISKAAQSFVTDNGLNPSFYMKSAQSHRPYSIARKTYIANGSHKKFKV